MKKMTKVLSIVLVMATILAAAIFTSCGSSNKVDCAVCGGTGSLLGVKCVVCDGTGKVDAGDMGDLDLSDLMD